MPSSIGLLAGRSAIGGAYVHLRGIAGVLVDPHAGDVLPVDLVAERAEEPQLVADDRAAERQG